MAKRSLRCPDCRYRFISIDRIDAHDCASILARRENKKTKAVFIGDLARESRDGLYETVWQYYQWVKRLSGEIRELEKKLKDQDGEK